MLCLIIFNLSWLIFDALFSSHWIQQGLLQAFPKAATWYRDQIHPNFVDYDLIFVSIFITELLFRWGHSVVKQTYHRWWFYPFIHWYDVLGCIPIGSFRFLRLLRVVSMLVRLHKYGVIDLTQTYPAQFLAKYGRVVVEEVSDRVVVNVLEGVKRQVVSGSPLVISAVDQVLRPRDGQIAAWLGQRVSDAIDQSYHSRRSDIEGYVKQSIDEAIVSSDVVSRYARMPLIGDQLQSMLQQAVSEIVIEVIHRLASDCQSPLMVDLFQESTNHFLDHLKTPNNEMSQLLQSIVLDSIDLVIAEVKIQQWKLQEGSV